jgi:hypothetical protein
LACVNTPQYPGPYPGPHNPGPYPGPQQNPYSYNPYGSSSPYPAAPAPQPVRRPGLLVVGLLLEILAALPFLFLGAFFLFAPLTANNVPPELLNSPRLQQAGATADLIISAMRLIGGIVLAFAVLYLLFGILAFAGRNWSRIILTVLTVGFALLLVAGLVASGGAVDTMSVSGVLLILVLGAVAILFSPGANAWYASRR